MGTSSAFLAVALLSSAFDFHLPVLSSVGGCRCPLYHVGEYQTACHARLVRSACTSSAGGRVEPEKVLSPGRVRRKRLSRSLSQQGKYETRGKSFLPDTLPTSK